MLSRLLIYSFLTVTLLLAISMASAQSQALKPGKSNVFPASGSQAPGQSSIATFNISPGGVESWDGLGDPDNEMQAIHIGAGNIITGIGWNVSISTVGFSWLSEASVQIGNTSGSSTIFLAPGFGNDAAGSMIFSSGGIISLAGVGIPDIPVDADGLIQLEFFESFDDVPDAVDANWVSGSLTFEYEPASPITVVPTLSEWGLIILGIFLLTLGTVFIRRKSMTSFAAS